MKHFFSKQTWIIWITALAIAAGLGAAMFAYTGPNRTRTEPVEVCNVNLWECQYVPAKDDYRYHKVRGWACSNESKPWQDYPAQPSINGCTEYTANSDNVYWEREYRVEETTVTYPPAEISAQPVCSLAGQNGWCRGGAGLQLTGYEPVAGEQITGIEWTLNGETFAVQNSASVTIPALEGQSDFQYWAHSSFTDTSLMGASTLYLDSHSPQVSSSSLVGTLGDNDWYISDVGISVSFSDPTPGSGLDGVSYILNGDTPQPFTSPLTLADGQHEVLIRAADLAGNLSELSQTVKVDTIPPHLEDALEGTLFDGWYAKTATLSASASDAGSGLAGMEVSLNGGGWAAYTVPLVIGDGQHQAVFRARDLAGNLSVSAPLPFKVDARGPRIDLPENWNIWDTAAFAVRDGESGLAEVEVILSDPQGRWPSVKRTYTPTGSRYDGQIGWNRRFSDDTLAPEGQYRVTVKASDLAGNFSQKEATLVIPAAGDIPGEGTIIQPVVKAEDPPLETTFVLPPEEPKAVPEPVETVFGGTSLALINEAWQANSLAAAPPLAAPPGILWGAGALAAMAAMTAYYEQKRREEEEAQRAAVHAQAAAKNAAIEAKREAYWEQVKTENYLQGKAMLEAVLKDSGLSDAQKAEIQEKLKTEGVAAGLELTVEKVEALGAPGGGKPLASPAPNTSMPPGLPPEAQYAFLHGGAAAQEWVTEKAPDLIAEYQAKLDKAKRDAQAKDTAASYSSQAAAWLGIDKYDEKLKMPKDISSSAQQAFLYGGTSAQQWLNQNADKVRNTSIPGLNLSNYSDWEKKVLEKLYKNGGADALNGVKYIVQNNINIKIGDKFEITDPIYPQGVGFTGDWQSLGDISGWYTKKQIVLHPQNNTYGQVPDNWTLSIVIHEARHIEQGPFVAFTKDGELDAYQIGIRVFMNLEGKNFSQLDPYILDMYNSTSGLEYGQKVEKYLPGYWKGLRLLPPYW